MAATLRLLHNETPSEVPIRLPDGEEDRVIGYEVVQVGKAMEAIKKGTDANEAIKKNTSTKGRFDDAVKYIDPREE